MNSEFLSKVVNSYCLAFGLREGAVGHESYFRCDEYLILELACDFLGQAFQSGIVVGEEVGEFHLDGHGVVVGQGLEGDEVVGGEFLELKEYLLYLYWEYVDSLEYDHVVAAALHAVESDVVASAWAFAWEDAGEVACAVTKERHGFAVDGGEHQFAYLAFRYWLEGVGIDYLDYVVVFPYM